MRYPIQSLVTKTSAFDGAAVVADNSVIPAGGMWTVYLHIVALTPNSTVRFQFSDFPSNNLSQITASKTFSFSGAVSPSADLVLSFNSRDYPAVPIGQANTSIRLSVASLSGTNASVTYEAWLATNGA